MTLKEELEALRGEPINVFSGNPKDIPCVETSDEARLCRRPVVSVNMITYNHENYIAQAIEGVMRQETDFEFELVIGEDCSQDRTRDICFEYQRKYPEKIRVLWWHENVSRLGGNSRRVMARCRGTYIAFCEGDDYWTDTHKLQKQVDALQRNPNVGFVFTGAKIFDEVSRTAEIWRGEASYSQGVIRGIDFYRIYSFGKNSKLGMGPECFIMTASCMLRRSILERLTAKYEIFNWKLLIGDKQRWLGMSLMGDVYYLKENTVVYRRNAGGAMNRHRNLIFRDSSIVKLYFAIVGPYRCTVPFAVIASVFLSRDGMPVDYWASCREELAAMRSIMKRCDVSFEGMKLGSRIRWHVFFAVKRRFVFCVNRASLKLLWRTSFVKSKL